MIRIDEIYNNTFWPWIQNNLPLTRLFFCDPPGHSDPESLVNFGADVNELHYIMLYDQEPIHFDYHDTLFKELNFRNENLNFEQGPVKAGLITSEYQSDNAAAICSKYNLQHFYYFFHGWAALDWYRGYNHTFLIKPSEHRSIQKSFLSPNRIIGGERDHRVLLMYHLLKQKTTNAHISFPKTCPVEGKDVTSIAQKFINQYPDITNTFNQTDLPLNFAGEIDHPMHSCWLSLFNESHETLAYVVTETVFFGRRNHLTEKTFKPICQKMPFVLVSCAHSLEYLKRYGFKTFNEYWDESYDNEEDDFLRLEKIAKLLKDLDSLSQNELQHLYNRTIPIIEYNFNHFYYGGFEQILWQEMKTMLDEIKHHWNN